MNTNRVFLFLTMIFLANPPPIHAQQEVALEIRVLNPHLLVGEPIAMTVDLMNVSAVTQRLSFMTESRHPEDNPSYYMTGLEKSGKSVGLTRHGFLWRYEQESDVPWIEGKEYIDLPPGKGIHIFKIMPTFGVNTGGDFMIHSKYKGVGKIVTTRIVNPVLCEGCWKGEVTSNSVPVYIQMPEGDEKEAKELAWKGDTKKIISRFPDSIFAAYLIYQSAGTVSLKSDIYYLDQQLSGKEITMGNLNIPDESFNAKDPDNSGRLKYSFIEVAKWRAKWCEIVLKRHPDIWFADELRLQWAVNQSFLKNYKDAAAALDALAKDPKSRMAGKAGEYLALLHERKLIQ